MPREVPESPQWFREAPESPPRPDDDHPTGPPIGRCTASHVPASPPRWPQRQHELQQPAAPPRRRWRCHPLRRIRLAGNPAQIVADLPPPLPATGVHCLPRA